MEHIAVIIELLEKIRKFNGNTLGGCPEDKLMKDADYSKLYQAFWQTDFRVGNVIELLKTIQ